MKLSHRRHRCYAIAAQLRQLLPLPRVDIHEPVHITDAEALHAVLGELLPLRS
jgi:hypothetical protein